MLAPMAELSHRALRELIEGFGGCDCYFTEMISAGAFVSGGPLEAWYADAGPRPEKTVYQLVGADTGHLAAAAALLDKKDCLGIDINMGCAAPAIARTGAGVRWMESADRAAAMTAAVRRATTRRLSVKLRIGPNDDFDYLVRFCRRLENEGVELITLHPRTAKEKFRRRARWEYVSALRRELGIPVAGNGDIASAPEMLRRGLECDGVMTGRLAVREPWVFRDARLLEKGIDPPEVTPALILETGLRFLELLARFQPPEFRLSRSRRFFGYFCGNLKWGSYVKTLLDRENDLAGVGRAWENYFAEHGNEEGGKPD